MRAANAGARAMPAPAAQPRRMSGGALSCLQRWALKKEAGLKQNDRMRGWPGRGLHAEHVVPLP
jgi:hypothetical protein